MERDAHHTYHLAVACHIRFALRISYPHSLSNVEALANGWPDIDVDDPRLPTITA